MAKDSQTKYDAEDKRLLALWAADCAERVLPLFEASHPGDNRPRLAVEALRSWVRGETPFREVRAAALAAHAAARDTGDPGARAAARAAGQAASTAHAAGHAFAAAGYAATAMGAAAISREREWQTACLPERLREAAADRVRTFAIRSG